MNTDESMAENLKDWVAGKAEAGLAEKAQALAEEFRRLESGLHVRGCEMARRVLHADRRIDKLERKVRKLKKKVKDLTDMSLDTADRLLDLERSET
jgi:hypothetical protein